MLSASEYLTEDYITRKILTILGDGDKADQIIKERTAEDMERIEIPSREEDEQWTEGTNEQSRS